MTGRTIFLLFALSFLCACAGPPKPPVCDGEYTPINAGSGMVKR